MSEAKPINLIAAIAEMKNKEPFFPFNIVSTSGEKYRIEQGSNLVEMKTEYFYAYPGGEGFVFIRKNQIAALELPESRKSGRRRAS